MEMETAHFAFRRDVTCSRGWSQESEPSRACEGFGSGESSPTLARWSLVGRPLGWHIVRAPNEPIGWGVSKAVSICSRDFTK